MKSIGVISQVKSLGHYSFMVLFVFFSFAKQYSGISWISTRTLLKGLIADIPFVISGNFVYITFSDVY